MHLHPRRLSEAPHALLRPVSALPRAPQRPLRLSPPADPCVCQGKTINENLIPQSSQPTSPKANPVTPSAPLVALGGLVAARCPFR
jgi:hypothetical protein